MCFYFLYLHCFSSFRFETKTAKDNRGDSTSSAQSLLSSFVSDHVAENSTCGKLEIAEHRTEVDKKSHLVFQVFVIGKSACCPQIILKSELFLNLYRGN
ncbi:hypothetical protein [Leptospira interrogans]|uniref:hypothetical protein n=2 Tax=Leptospira interrogans TaxID=173 RepID=UPI00046C6E04|nr:hypothetical protein [Leptospira interrogans]